jgi:hypothetical protein
MTLLEFMLLNPAPGSCTGDVGFVQHGETARRCESIELRLPPFPDRIASEPSLRGAEQPSAASSLLRPGHFGLLWLPASRSLDSISLRQCRTSSVNGQQGNEAGCHRAEERQRPPRT